MPQSEDLASFSNKAEKNLKEQTETIDNLSKEAVERLFHELSRHQTELELQNEELRKKYSELYDLAPVSYFTFDTHGLIQQANDAGAKLLGIDRHILIRMSFSVFIADEDGKNIFHSHLLEVLRKQTQQICEIKLQKNNGPVFDAKLQTMPVHDTKGNIVGCRATVADITELKQTKVALRCSKFSKILSCSCSSKASSSCPCILNSEEKFTNIFLLSPERISIVTLKEGRYVEVNQQFLNFSGYSREEVIGRTSRDLAIWVDLSEREEVWKRLREKRELNNYETKFRNKKGDIRTVLWSAEVIDYGGEPCVLAMTHDITARKQAEEALQTEMISLKHRLLTDQLLHEEAFSHIITTSKHMRAIFQYMEVIAPSEQPVLITGETGVGKELIAKAVHTLSVISGRKGSFVAVNVAGLDDTMFSDTLFGHRRGAYTGADQAREGLIARASGGTLFLDEIGDLAESSQVKLLRLLQDRNYYPLGSDKLQETDARVIVATNRDMQVLLSSGKFRKDLYYRLRAYQIHIPPLRERKDDIPLLLHYFIEEAAASLKKKKPTPTPELVHLLAAYDFPGNVRELRAIVYDALARNKSDKLSMEGFRELIKKDEVVMSSDGPSAGDSDAFVRVFGHFPSLKEVEDFLIAEALDRSNRNQGTAALLLGMTRQGLNRRLRRPPDPGE
jgi:two-component system response regulator HydG